MQANTTGAMFAAQRFKRWFVAAGVACGLVVLVAVVALAGRAPLGGGSASVNASSASTPLTALFVVVVGGGFVGLCALAVFIWPGRRHGDGEPEHERPPLLVHWAWKLAAIVLPLVLGVALLAAAALGVRIFSRPAPLQVGSLTHRVVPAPVSGHRTGSFELPSWLPGTVLGVLAVSVVLLGAWLMARRSPALGEGPLSRPGTRAAVEAAIEALDSNQDPRGAVIAAYAAMERTLAVHDLGRLTSEAPREYLRRVLAASQAPTRQAAIITGLFEEARFSTHPISEHARSRTLAALSALRAGLGTDGVR
jgi:hypothetical protein